MRVVHRIARKQLVAAITAEGDGHVLANKTCEQICRDKRTIRQRFIEPGSDLADQIARFFSGQPIFVMLSAEMRCHFSCEFRFVERIFFKAYGKCFYFFGCMLRGECCDSR